MYVSISKVPSAFFGTLSMLRFFSRCLDGGKGVAPSSMLRAFLTSSGRGGGGPSTSSSLDPGSAGGGAPPGGGESFGGPSLTEVEAVVVNYPCSGGLWRWWRHPEVENHLVDPVTEVEVVPVIIIT